ncbi:MAG: stage II sporulation protein E (SpoIIE) [Bacteroidetes bacterium]|nr:MAG: stage II sporulation protein E (SpoIIE) [Bacteroidota bacterium]
MKKKKLLSPVKLEWGAAAYTLTGQKESGDQFTITSYNDGVLIGVVDGLGHGNEAAVAAKKAISTLEIQPQQSVITLIKRCHEELKGTRGVVMSLAAIDARDETITWLAVGNVETFLTRIDEQSIPLHEYLLMRGGVIGYHLPLLHASVMPLTRGDTIIFATDGIQVGFAREWSLKDPPQIIADRICSNYAKGTDDALVLVVRYLGVDR